MSLLSNESMPHECTIRKRIKTRQGSSTRDTHEVVATGVKCWQQGVSSREVNEFQQRGFDVETKIYFNTEYNLTSRHEIIITKRNSTAVPESDQRILDVVARPDPDVSAGLGCVYAVFCSYNTSENR